MTLQFIVEKQRVELFQLISSCPDFSTCGLNLARLYAAWLLGLLSSLLITSPPCLLTLLISQVL